MQTHASNTLLGISIPTGSKKGIRENIIKNIKHDRIFFHIVSLNPENIVLSTENPAFKRVIAEAQMRIIDGSGVGVACWVLGVACADRYAGVDLMTDLLDIANSRRLRVLLIGGGPKIAEKVVECQKPRFPGISFHSLEGIADISIPTDAEEKRIATIVTATKPHMVFIAYGSPAQELWIDRHSRLFDGMVVMGVGGAFDFLSENIPRAPARMRALGLEWLFRLLRQPWRIGRQLRLVKFIWLVLKERILPV